MNPLILSLALSTPAHPPAPVPPPAPVQARPSLNLKVQFQVGQPQPPMAMMPTARPPVGFHHGPPMMPPGGLLYSAFGPTGMITPNAFAPAPPVPPMHRPMTLEHFAHCFIPTPGVHHIVLIHPCTGQPTPICLELPAGCVKVKARSHSLEFDYGRRQVEIRFLPEGGARVFTD